MLDLLLHLIQQRELIGNGCIEEEDVLYATGWVQKEIGISGIEIKPNK